MGQGALWSAPVNPPEGRHAASIRFDQSPLRRDQISVKLSSPAPFTSEAQIGVDLSAICDIEIASWTPRVLDRGRATGRAAIRNHAPSFERLAPSPSCMRGRTSLSDRRGRILVRRRCWQPWRSPSVRLMGASHATSNGRIRPEGRLRLDRLPATARPAFFPCREVAAFLAERLRADRSPGQGPPSRLR